MDKKEKYELMQKIARELEDLANSQTSVLKKISQIEVDNIQLSSQAIDNVLPNVHESVDESLNKITELSESFIEDIEKFKSNNEAALSEDPTA